MASANETVLKGTVRYDGARFHGWQRQENCRTVQEALEKALARISGCEIPIQGAGRTDAGVHALGQVFSCRWPGTPPDRLRHALCGMLAPEICVTHLQAAPADFDARFSAHSKRYVYAFDFSRHSDPFTARYAWHVPYRLDLELFQATLQTVIGTHDFSGFQSAGNQMKNTIRTLLSARLCPGGFCAPMDAKHLWHVNIHGDGFLYKMVRNICGTLVEIARGRFPASYMAECLSAGGPFRGHCAPPHGLALARVYYAGDDIPSCS